MNRLAALLLMVSVSSFLGMMLVPSVSAQTLNEKRQGIYGLIKTVDGEPLAGLQIVLVKNVTKKAFPLKVKTNKEGRFIYPQVELFNEGYKLSVETDEYYIKDYQIRTRRGTGERWQDDEGSLTPKNQDQLPFLRYRGANATIYLTLERIADFTPVRSTAARAEAAATPQRAPAGRELSPIEQAEEALALGDPRLAATKLEEALLAAPDDVDLRWRRAEVLVEAGDQSAALREAQKVVAADPERAGVRVSMAEWMSESGQLASAIPLLEDERKLSPSDTKVLKLLVEAYDQAGRSEDSLSALNAWAELAPEDPAPLLELAGLAAQEGDFGRSEELYEMLAQRDPENADRMYVNAGISILNKRGASEADRRRAKTAFEKGIEVNPKNARAHVELGYALLQLGEQSQARQHFAEFLKLAPGDARAAEVQAVLDALSR